MKDDRLQRYTTVSGKIEHLTDKIAHMKMCLRDAKKEQQFLAFSLAEDLANKSNATRKKTSVNQS
jgi:hypothetical protein